MPQPKTAQVRAFSLCVFAPQCTDKGRKVTCDFL